MSIASAIHDYIAPVLGTVITLAVLFYNNRKVLHQQKEMHAANEATHAAWVESTNKMLSDHEDRLDDHQGRFEDLSRDYAPRTEVQREIKSIQSSFDTLNHWLQTFLPIMLARVVPGGYFPMPEPPKSEEKK